MNEQPSVAGRMEMRHDDFRRACQATIGELQENVCDNSNFLIGLLCEAVRCSRQCSELETANAKIADDIGPKTSALRGLAVATKALLEECEGLAVSVDDRRFAAAALETAEITLAQHP